MQNKHYAAIIMDVIDWLKKLKELHLPSYKQILKDHKWHDFSMAYMNEDGIYPERWDAFQ